MTPERWARIKDIFAVVVEEPAEVRQSALAKLCTDDTDLQSQVEELLVQHDRMGGFLEGSGPRPLASPENVLHPGDVLAGRYQILEFIGSGGMGEVYAALDKELGDRVALKTIRQETALEQSQVDRLRREVQLSRRVTHPNVCRVFDLGHDRQQGREIIFLTMELIEGETLTTRLKRCGKIDPAEALRIAEQLCQALGAAHQAGVLHRDFKCGNVMLIGSGEHVRAVVTDFGIAGWIKPPDETLTVGTAHGMVIGTPAYMSPEQLLGEKLTAASDIYSLGLVLYEMVTGIRPFKSETGWSESLKRLATDPPSPVTIVPDLDPRWTRTILKCLARDIEKRFSSTRQVAESLKKQRIFPSLELSRRTLAIGVAVVALLAATAVVVGNRLWPAVDSVAVMPLTYSNADPKAANDPEREYLADGLTESLIDAISAVSDVKVISRTSVFRYKGRDADPSQLGRDLGVNRILYGKMVQQGDDLKIDLELVDAATSRHVWGNHYDAKILTLVSLPREVALQIVDSLHFRSRKSSFRLYTASPTAYQEYLRGRHQLNKRTEEGIRGAIAYFQKAIASDPQYALAYAGLADAYHVLWVYSKSSPRDSYLLAKPAALKALEIDPTLAEAHTSMAVIKADDEWDFAGAEREFRRAIELDPNYATAHQWYAQVLGYQGRFDEAVSELRLAIRLDPLSPVIHVTLGDMLYQARRYDQSNEELKKALDIDSGFPLAHSLLRNLYEARGDFTDAIAESKAAKLAWGDTPEEAEAAVVDLRRGYADAGEAGYWRAQLGLIEQGTRTGHVRLPDDSPVRVAGIYAHLGDREQAFHWLATALEQRDTSIVYIKTAPEFDSLRSDPRAAELIKRIGL